MGSSIANADFVNVANWLCMNNKAENIKYDNSQSGLAADNTQWAIDELSATIGSFAERKNINLTITSGSAYEIINGVVAIKSSQSKYTRADAIDVTGYVKVGLIFYLIEAWTNVTVFTDDQGNVVGDKLVNTTEDYIEYGVPEGATKLYLCGRKETTGGSATVGLSAYGMVRHSVKEVTDNIQDNIEESYEEIDLNLYPAVYYRVLRTNGNFSTNTTDRQIFVPVTGGEEYRIEYPNTVEWGHYSWVTNIDVSGTRPSYCEGEDNAHVVGSGGTARITAPSDAKYILITVSNQGTSTKPSSLSHIIPFPVRIDDLDDSAYELDEKTSIFIKSLSDVVGTRTKSTGEFRTSTNSYVVSSDDYGYWYDVTSIVGRKIKFIKGEGQLRFVFTNAILENAASSVASYVLSNIVVSNNNVIATVPNNDGSPVYLWVHYIKNEVLRWPASMKICNPVDTIVYEHDDEINQIQKDIYGVGQRIYYGKKINLRNKFYAKVTILLMSLDSGTSTQYLQGADVYGDLFFQFFVGGRCCVYNLLTLTKVKEFTMSNLNKSDSQLAHWGSVHFSNEFENEGDELPLIYTRCTNIAGDGGDISVVNINAAYAGTGEAEVVRFITLVDYPYSNSSVCCAFDFEKREGYLIGRPDNSQRFGRYYIQPFDIDSGSYNIEDLIDVKSSGPMQDAVFRNGVVYILSGWNDLYNSEGYTDYAVPQRITAVGLIEKAITTVLETGISSSNNSGEPEGIAIYDNNFYVSRRSSSTGNKLMLIEV